MSTETNVYSCTYIHVRTGTCAFIPYNLQCINELFIILSLCTIDSKISGTPKGVYLPIFKIHSILAIANLLAHINSWLCYYGQVNSLRLKSSVASKWASKHLWGTIYFVVGGTLNISNGLYTIYTH